VGPLAVVDLETTGLSNEPEAEILEFGAVLLDPGSDRATTVESLVRPAGDIPRAVQRLTGLTDGAVADAPTIGDLAKSIAVALEGRTIVAHNADFERHFLTRYVSQAFGDRQFLDTQDLLAITHSDAPDLRLETFTRDMLGTEERHRALADALDTARVMSDAAIASTRGEFRYTVARAALETFAPEAAWLPLIAETGLPRAVEAPPQFVAIPAQNEKPVPFDADAIAAALGDAERGRRHFPGYRVREEQIAMARQFAATLGDGGTLLLEGGTGVGKSLAYLAAAIPFAMERAAGGIRDPIVISTRTKLLQDQLLEKDIPAAAAMLGYPELKVVSIKGRANYVCTRRSEQVLTEGQEPSIFEADRLAYAALRSCTRLRRHGEIGTIPGALLFRFPTLRDLLRRSVAARSEHCTREQCASEPGCPFGRRRSALSRAHLVIANHDLLLRWPPDYPNFTHAIADEAHELVGVADEVYALDVRPLEVLERFDELFGRPGEQKRSGSLLPPGRLRGMSKDIRAWRREIQQDFVGLGRTLAGRASEFGEVQLPPHAEKIFADAVGLAEAAASRLEAAADVADEIDGARESESEEGEDLGVARAVGDLRAAADGLRQAFGSGLGDAVAAFERLEPPFDRWRLVIRAVSPAQAFHRGFAERLEAFACVSASLFVGGDSTAALGELEIDDGGEEVTRMVVESPFPYARHMRVVAFESGGDLVDETTTALADLARLLGGRTLGLFTSLRRMRDVHDRLAEALRGEGYDILSPRRATDDPAALVERFSRSSGGGVLLGARMFWQGLDIPGAALQAVVIEKLPFEVPTELRKRREARIKAAGGDAFGRYTMGKMLLNLKQMAGRLIRSEEDRGVVVIVEGRTDKRYFTRLKEALPPDCVVSVAARRDLPSLLRAVEIEPAAAPAKRPDAG
jgi:ATP-dependent DNA helicase DinG